MTLQNRVHPNGSLHAVPVRGTLMGNRGGRFHCPQTQALVSQRRWVSHAWIACRLTFKSRHRQVWATGYTELFFLDEVTALAAGHRPCFECRRIDAKRFQAALFEALRAREGLATPPKATPLTATPLTATPLTATPLTAMSIDRLLHRARTGKSIRQTRLGALPVGAIACSGQTVWAVAPDGPRRWSFNGYGRVDHGAVQEDVKILTPEPILYALMAGYRPQWHPTADQSHDDQSV